MYVCTYNVCTNICMYVCTSLKINARRNQSYSLLIHQLSSVLTHRVPAERCCCRCCYCQ